MKNYSTILLFFVLMQNAFSQNYLNTYYPTGISDTIQNPPITPKLSACGMINPLQIGSNNDFRVRVKNVSTDPWQELFEYNTFVNSSSGDLQGVARSSFVSFDYTGTVIVQIKCNKYATVNPANVIIRPQVLATNISVVDNIITFSLATPSSNNTGIDFSNKLSVEINGNRYNNLQIFANRKYEPTATAYTKTYYANQINVYDTALNNNTGIKRIKIEKGAILSVPYEGSSYSGTNGKIVMNSGDEIYIEGGGVLNGGIIATDKEQIKVYGRGIIDLTNYPKKYQQDDLNAYAWTQPLTFRRCKDITLDGLIVNDSQQLCVELTDCGGTTAIKNININNMKFFSHAVWGDGIHMRGTSNVSINDCYNRTSDDCISIYASRRQSWDLCDSAYKNQIYNDAFNLSTAPYPGLIDCTNAADAIAYQNRDALNIKVTNTLLYADNAHAIEIGWHGNQLLNNGRDIYNLNFENIDILEHDQNWIQQNGQVIRTYDGAIGINCADDNKCSNFLFKDIRIEDFTAGSILTIRVMPYGEGDAKKSGKLVQDIRFENLSYKGTGENKSIIDGVNCDRFVNGVHFQNFTVASPTISKLVTSSNWTTYFDTNQYAYNITFEEANNYSTTLADGYYTIKSASSQTNFLKNTSPTPYATSNTNTTDSRVWHIVNVQGTGHYRVHLENDDTKTLQNSFIITKPTAAAFVCNGRYLTIENDNAALTNQEWKIVPISSGSSTYKINNAYTRSYITYSTAILSSNTVALPKVSSIVQNWIITPAPGYLSKISNADTPPNSASNEEVKEIVIFPNPTNDFLNINNLKDSKYTLEVFDLKGSKVLSENVDSENSKIYVGAINKGVYLVKIEKDGVLIHTGKFIKN